MTNTAAGGDKAVNASITQSTNALTGNLIAGAFVATNSSVAAANGVIYGLEVKSRAATSGNVGNTIGRLDGVYSSVDAKNKTATTMRAFEASLDGGAGGSSTEAVAFEAFNNSSATQTASYAFSANGGTASGHKVYTADMRMQNGALFDNAADGVLEFNEASDELKLTFGSNTVTLSSTDVTAFDFSGGISSSWGGATSGSIKIAPIATGTAATTIQNQNISAATITLPSATTTLPGLSLNNVYTGTAEWDGATSGGIKIAPIATGTALTTIANQNISAATITLPSATCTLPGLGLANTWTGTNAFGDVTTVTYTKTAAADVGTVLALYGKYALTGATPVNTAGNNLVGARGELNMASGTSVTEGAYMEGLQAKAIVAGTINHADSRLASLFAQADFTGAAFTAGQQSVIWADVQVAPTTVASGQFNLLRLTNGQANTAVQPNAIIFAYSEAAYFMEVSAPEGNADWYASGGTDCTASGATDPLGTIKINFFGTPAYIRVWSAP